MTCEKYKDALIDAAAGEPLDRGLADHLEDCTPCRATLEREQELFAAIDCGLRVRVCEQPRNGFLTRVQAQIADDPQRKSRWVPVWALPVAAVAVVLIVMAHPWEGSRKHTIAGNRHEPVAPAQKRPEVAQSAPSAKEGVRVRARRRVRSAEPSVIERVAEREPEVLVPPDEAEVFAQFVARVAGRDDRAAAVVRPMRDEADENTEWLQIQSGDIAELQSEPLAWEEN